MDEVGSLENGEQPADNGHLTRYILVSLSLSFSLYLGRGSKNGHQHHLVDTQLAD